MTVVITPVGTSLFTNGSKTNNSIKTGFGRIEDKPEGGWDQTGGYIKSLRTACENFIRGIQNDPKSASAELQSSDKIQNELRSDITVHLLASDTIASRLAAEVLSGNVAGRILGNQVSVNFEPDQDIIRGLQVNNRRNFLRKGMNALIRRIEQINLALTGSGQSLAINITGGYGATLPYLTIYAQLKCVPLYYNFEDSNELIEIPPSPLSIDWDAIGPYFDTLHRIDNGEAIENWTIFEGQNQAAVRALDPFIFVDQEDNSAYLSPLGDIFWNQYLKSNFIVDLAININKNAHIDNVIQDLYRRLDLVLRSHNLDPSRCYNVIRQLKTDDDLNHTGAVQGHNIFIFKSTDVGHIRLMYTFEVNGRAITRLKIYDQRGHMNTQGYEEWKTWISRNHAQISFNLYPFHI